MTVVTKTIRISDRVELHIYDRPAGEPPIYELVASSELTVTGESDLVVQLTPEEMSQLGLEVARYLTGGRPG